MEYTPDSLRQAGLNPDGLRFCGKFPPYDPMLVGRARELRNDSTKSEAYLWQVLKNKRLGYKFSRQKPILHYIADFYCHELSLVVEIDGSTHNSAEAQKHDAQRDADMQALGLHIVRLDDNMVIKNPLASAQHIFTSIGVEIPKVLDFLATGDERLWGTGYLGRIL